MFEQITDVSLGAFARLLSFFYSLPVIGGNYGVAIILLTMTVMILLMPLTLKATRSTIKMTQMQPKMKELQQKYKGPEKRQELNAELMALYQEEGINPVGGCLPMLAQLPVFLVLFNVLRGLTRRIAEKPYFSAADKAHELAGRPTTPSRNFDPNYIDPDSVLYQDLSKTDEMRFGPFDLAESAWNVFQTDIVSFLPYFVLILFVVGTSYYQQKQISARRGDSNEPLTPQQQTQQQLLRVLPLMSGAWSFVFPAGLVLYWATSNMFRVGQQSYITRSLYRGDGIGAQMLHDRESQRADDDEQGKGKGDKNAKTNGSSGDDGTSDNSSDEAADSSSKSSSNKKSSNGSNRSKNGSDGSDGKSTKKSQQKLDKAANNQSKANTSGETPGDSESTNGSSLTTAAEREQRWAEKRAKKAKTQERRSESGNSSSRLTPKGTKPTASRKPKRKR